MTGRPLALVGYRASGKTSLGRSLAAALSREFVDLDAVIEAEAGRSIAGIFQSDGEESFRALEERVLAGTLARPRVVVATGGGIVEREVNRKLLQRNAQVVYLSLAADDLLERLRAGPERPSLTGLELSEEVRQVLARRDPWYRQVADEVLEIPGTEAPSDTLQRLMQLLGRPA